MNDFKRKISKTEISAAIGKAVAIEQDRIEQIRADDIDKVVGGAESNGSVGGRRWGSTIPIRVAGGRTDPTVRTGGRDHVRR